MGRFDGTGERVALGILLIILGSIFLLNSLGITDAGFSELWPVLLISAGAMLVYDRLRRAWRRR